MKITYLILCALLFGSSYDAADSHQGSTADRISNPEIRNVAARAIPDTDGDGVANNVDLDDDNDGITDSEENNCTVSSSTHLSWDIDYWDVNYTPFPGGLQRNALGTAIDEDNSTISFGNGFAVSESPAGFPYRWAFSGANARSYADALAQNEYMLVTIPMSESGGDRVYELSHWLTWLNTDFSKDITMTIAISTNPDFNEPTILYSGASPNSGYGFKANALIEPFRLKAGSTYLVRLYFYGPNNSFTYDHFTLNTICYTDTDRDGIPDLEDTDSDNDGCPDSNEYYNDRTAAGSDGRFGSATDRTVGTDGKVVGASYAGKNHKDVITAADPINIANGPADRIIDAAGNTTYRVNASVATGNLQYQWQVSRDEKTTWTAVADGALYSGSTTNTLSLSAVSKEMNGYFYRVLVSKADNVCGVYSASASLDIKPKATDDDLCYTPGKAKTVNVLDNDHTGDKPVATTVVIATDGATNGGKTLVVSNEGTWQVNTAGTISFTPKEGFTNSPTSISYTVKDNEQNVSNVAKIALTATGTPKVVAQGSTAKSF